MASFRTGRIFLVVKICSQDELGTMLRRNIIESDFCNRSKNYRVHLSDNFHLQAPIPHHRYAQGPLCRKPNVNSFQLFHQTLAIAFRSSHHADF